MHYKKSEEAVTQKAKPSEIIPLILTHIPLDALQRRVRLSIQLIQPRELLQKLGIVEGWQHHIEPLRLICLKYLSRTQFAHMQKEETKDTHYLAATRAPAIRRARNGHVPKLCQEPPQLMRHDPEGAAARVRIGQLVVGDWRWGRCTHTFKHSGSGVGKGER
jgi:hypothetical protein